jgi:hypothetical protein
MRPSPPSRRPRHQWFWQRCAPPPTAPSSVHVALYPSLIITATRTPKSLAHQPLFYVGIGAVLVDENPDQHQEGNGDWDEKPGAEAVSDTAQKRSAE